MALASEPTGDGRRDRVAEASPRAEGVVDRGRLVSAVHHAVAALLVATAPTVVLPAGRLEQILERGGVALLKQIAGTLPAEDVVGRVAPRRALELLLAHEELQEQRRLIEPPPALRLRQNLRDQIVGALGAQEVLLIRRLVEELAHAQRIGVVEQGRVRRDAESPAERLFDALDGLVVDAVAAHRL